MLSETLIWLTAITAFLLSRFAEVRVHHNNYNKLIEAGAEELQPNFMRRYYRFFLFVIPLAFAEQLITKAPLYQEMWLGGLTLLAAGLALRLWSIHSLGNLWSMRCLSLRGLKLVKAGPYRLLKNPEYLSRFLDVAGICLLFGAKITFLGCILLLAAMTARIVTVEQRQLREVGCGLDLG